MAKIVVSGLITIETTMQVENFPIKYQPVDYSFFGIESGVSGVGYNVAKGLSKLGNTTRLLSLVGKDLASKQVFESLSIDHIPSNFVLDRIAQTAQSVIIFDKDGRNQIHVDLKNIQDQGYPIHHFEQAAAGCDLSVLCNINFSRPFLQPSQKMGKLIATDVHTISDPEDPYNLDFMQAADILFMSNQLLPTTPEEWVAEIMGRYGAQIVVIGLGAEGALLAVREDDFIGRYPYIETRPLVNSIGGGDALFSGFIHSYLRSKNPYEAIQKAILFASYKIGVISASRGFLTHSKLEKYYSETKSMDKKA